MLLALESLIRHLTSITTLPTSTRAIRAFLKYLPPSAKGLLKVQISEGGGGLGEMKAQATDWYYTEEFEKS